MNIKTNTKQWRSQDLVGWAGAKICRRQELFF